MERASAQIEDEEERSAQGEGVKEAFKQLVQARYVEKAPQAEPVLPPATEGDVKKGTRMNPRCVWKMWKEVACGCFEIEFCEICVATFWYS